MVRRRRTANLQPGLELDRNTRLLGPTSMEAISLQVAFQIPPLELDPQKRRSGRIKNPTRAVTTIPESFASATANGQVTVMVPRTAGIEAPPITRTAGNDPPKRG